MTATVAYAALGLTGCACGKLTVDTRDDAMTAAALLAAKHDQQPVPVRVYPVGWDPACGAGARPGWHWTRKGGALRAQPVALLPAPDPVGADA